MNRFLNFFFIAALAGAVCACRKESPSPRKEAPALSAPEKDGFTRPNVPAAAEVSASSGAVKFSLSMPTTAYHKADHAIWVKVSMTNIGTEPLFIFSKSLFAGAPALMSVDLWKVEIQDAGGERVYYEAPMHPISGDCVPDYKRLDRRELMRKYARDLAPGATVSTPSVPDLGGCPNSRRDTIGDFGQIPGLYLIPGGHRIRAVFDQVRPSGISGAPGPGEVRVETPWMNFEVLP